MQVFAVIFDSSYTMSRTKKGYALFERGGSVVPSRLDFEKRNGKWDSDGLDTGGGRQLLCGFHQEDVRRRQCTGEKDDFL